MRAAVCVLGFHRSGTSMTTRLLNLLGVELGDDLLPPDPVDNPRGFWEPRWMVRFNDEVLAAAGASYMQPPARDVAWERLDALRERAAVLLDERVPDAPLVGFKDPRLCLTWPFWHDLVAERVDAIRYVVCVRSPLETAASMVRRDRYPGVGHADWGALWLDYLARALAGSRGGDRLFVFYDDLLRDPRAEADRLAAWLGVPTLADAVLAGAVDGSLRHHAASASETAGDTRLPGAARAAYAALQAAATAPAELAVALTDGAEALAAEHAKARAARGVERGSLEEALAALQAADVREDGLRIALREAQEQVKRLNAALADARGARLAA